MAKVAYGGPQHRREKVKLGKRSPIRLLDNNPAIRDSRTVFPTQVVHPSMAPRLLVSGHNSRKIGSLVTKGRWRGFRIYTLTLEERATCPASCLEWRTCYGNNMHWARRHIAGIALEQKLGVELKALAKQHPRGFVVRLHVLGDFYSPDYVRFWRDALDKTPQLHIFGYTARAPESDIGAEILSMTQRPDDRCWIRFSGLDAGGLGSLVIDHKRQSKHVVCPAQLEKTDCCATCALCWTMDRTVEFLRH